MVWGANLQRGVTKILSEARGDGDLLSVLAKRVEHFGFDRPGDHAVNFIGNVENAPRVLKPFVLGSIFGLSATRTRLRDDSVGPRAILVANLDAMQ